MKKLDYASVASTGHGLKMGDGITGTIIIVLLKVKSLAGLMIE